MLRPAEDSSYIGTPKTISLQTHIGEDPTTTIGQTWSGYIGNKTITSTLLADSRTQYPEAFIVDYPEIADIVRADRTLTANYNYTLAIPNDTLDIEF